MLLNFYKAEERGVKRMPAKVARGYSRQCFGAGGPRAEGRCDSLRRG